MPLGRGLNSLIPPKSGQSTPAHDDLAHAQDQVVAIPVTDIVPNPHQPRRHFSHSELEELITSVKEHGILQPLLVSRLDDHYQLIAGERRLRAARIAGLDTVPALVRDVNELEKLELALIENIQRSDLNPIERADSYRKLLNEFGLNHDEAAQKVGISRSSFSNSLRLLDLPTEVQTALADGHISEGHAKVLLGLASRSEQLKQLQAILNDTLSVRGLEARVQGRTKQSHRLTSKSIHRLPPHVQAMQDDLMATLATKVRINPRGNGGTITVEYYSAEELAQLVGHFTKNSSR